MYYLSACKDCTQKNTKRYEMMTTKSSNDTSTVPNISSS